MAGSNSGLSDNGALVWSLVSPDSVYNSGALFPLTVCDDTRPYLSTSAISLLRRAVRIHLSLLSVYSDLVRSSESSGVIYTLPSGESAIACGRCGRLRSVQLK